MGICDKSASPQHDISAAFVGVSAALNQIFSQDNFNKLQSEKCNYSFGREREPKRERLFANQSIDTLRTQSHPNTGSTLQYLQQRAA